MKIREKYTCPLELSLDMIAGKWKPIILWRLRLGAQQLVKLNKDIHGINQKMLIEHLSELVSLGIVSKKTYEGYPLKVEYALTEIGWDYIDGLEVFQKIGQDILTSEKLAIPAVHTAKQRSPKK